MKKFCFTLNDGAVIRFEGTRIQRELGFFLVLSKNTIRAYVSDKFVIAMEIKDVD